MRSIRGKIITWLLVSIVAASAVFGWAVIRGFYPKARYELPVSKNKRLFAQAIESSDETIHVKASDWPYTFWKPFTLGDAEWRERYTTSQFFWSNDRTVVAFFAQEKSDVRPYYVSAYDYSAHEFFGGSTTSKSKENLNREIETLLNERGGRETSPIEIPGLNSGLYKR